MGTQDLRALGTLAASFLRHISCEVVRRMSNANLEATLRWASAGAWMTLAGALLSGPISLVLVNATHPQPPWQDSAVFVRQYHPIQTLRFFLGFVLVGGLVVTTAGVSLLAKPEHRGSLGAEHWRRAAHILQPGHSTESAMRLLINIGGGNAPGGMAFALGAFPIVLASDFAFKAWLKHRRGYSATLRNA